jgi:hypothetical protein
MDISLTPAQKDIFEEVIISFDEAIAVTPGDIDTWQEKPLPSMNRDIPKKKKKTSGGLMHS